jgi:hypothetical protein
VRKTLLFASALVLACLVFAAPRAAAQNWYGHTMATFYWDDSRTTLVGTMVNSTCADNPYHYQDGQVTSNITRDAQPCNGGAPTFVQIAPAGTPDLGQCLFHYYLITWDPRAFIFEGTFNKPCLQW